MTVLRPSQPLRIAADAACVGLAGLMVSPLRIRKPRGAAYGILLLVALALSALYLIVPYPA